MKYFYSDVTGQILLKTSDHDYNKISNPYIITDQIIADWDLDQYKINAITKQLEKVNP